MAFEPSIAVFDACILYPFHLRNIVVQAAVDRLVDARWTDEIHDEWIRNLVVGVPGLPVERLRQTRLLMNVALPSATVTGYEPIMSSLALPDPDDRHVVAAATTAGASLIITWNLRDFPADALARLGLRAITPDDFLTELYDATPKLTMGSLASARRNLNKSRVSAAEFVDILHRQKLVRLAGKVRHHLTDL
jgi:hypothetical protein